MISISPARFGRILRTLKRKGYRTLLLDEAVDWLAGKHALSAPAVVLTFDDGFENLYTEAFPLLDELGYKATVFLTTGYCGKLNNWPSQTAGIPPMPILSWPQIKEMARSVFDVQAHTQTHPNLTRLSPASAREELAGSQAEIEEQLGKQARFFAYPYGSFDDRIHELAREYFEAACSTKLSFVDAASDRHALERVDMYYFAGGFSSSFFGYPGCRSYLRLRRILREARHKAGET